MPTILGATRVTVNRQQNGQVDTSETLIDNILIKANMQHISGLVENKISDHYPVYT